MTDEMYARETTGSGLPDTESLWSRLGRRAKKQNETAQDRYARRGTFANSVIAFSTVVTTFAAIATYFVVKGQLDSAKLDERPWIGDPLIESTGCDNAKHDIVAFWFSFKNSGKTPTTGLHIVGDLTWGDNWFADAVSLCDRQKTGLGDLTHGFRNFAIFPGGTFKIQRMVPRKFDAVNVTEIGSKKDPWIIGCVLYGSQFDTTVHRTLYAAELKVKNQDVCVDPVYSLTPD